MSPAQFEKLMTTRLNRMRKPGGAAVSEGALAPAQMTDAERKASALAKPLFSAHGRGITPPPDMVPPCC